MSINVETADADEPGEADLEAQLLAIGRECAERLKEPYRSIDHPSCCTTSWGCRSDFGDGTSYPANASNFLTAALPFTKMDARQFAAQATNTFPVRSPTT